MNDTAPDLEEDPLASYVEALLQCTGTLMLIVDHMAVFDATHSPEEPPDESAPETLRRLLQELVASEIGPGGEDVAAATWLLERTTGAIREEIYLVPPAGEHPDACHGRRRRRRR